MTEIGIVKKEKEQKGEREKEENERVMWGE